MGPPPFTSFARTSEDNAISVYLRRPHGANASTLYYEQRANGLGTAFLNEVDATLTGFFSTRTPGTNCPHEPDAVERIAFRLV